MSYSLPVLGSSKKVDVALPENISSHILFEVVRWQLAGRRRGTAATKTRGMVNFTTKKMYAQKGTGNARHGDYAAPIFVGGGVAFGPQPRDYSYTLPKKVRKLGLSMALADRAKEGKLFLTDGFSGVAGKTKEFAAFLNKAGLEGNKVLVVTSDETVARSARNLPRVRVVPATALNVYDIIRQEALVIDLPSWDAVSARLGQGGEA